MLRAIVLGATLAADDARCKRPKRSIHRRDRGRQRWREGRSVMIGSSTGTDKLCNSSSSLLKLYRWYCLCARHTRHTYGTARE